MKNIAKSAFAIGLGAAAIGGSIYMWKQKDMTKKAGKAMLKAMNSMESAIASKIK